MAKWQNGKMAKWQNGEAWQKVFNTDSNISGDVGYFNEKGYVYIVDRAKDMVVTAGENVYSTEVEKLLVIATRYRRHWRAQREMGRRG